MSKRTIKDLVKDAHKTAELKGWWDVPTEFGTQIALCHSELSEALEEYRKGCKPDEVYQELDAGLNKKERGIPSELADVCIRIFDLCGAYGIDLEEAINRKMEYNKSRPYKHGGKII